VASFQHGAGNQTDMDVTGRIRRTWKTAIHAGMTVICISILAAMRKIINHFAMASFRL
jgi:hypothetical protein